MSTCYSGERFAGTNQGQAPANLSHIDTVARDSRHQATAKSQMNVSLAHLPRHAEAHSWLTLPLGQGPHPRKAAKDG